MENIISSNSHLQTNILSTRHDRKRTKSSINLFSYSTFDKESRKKTQKVNDNKTIHQRKLIVHWINNDNTEKQNLFIFQRDNMMSDDTEIYIYVLNLKRELRHWHISYS